MTFIEAIEICLSKKYFNFKGRACRKEFWFFFLFYVLSFIGMSIFSIYASNFFSGNIVNNVIVGIVIFLFIPLMAVTSRRLHDSNLSGLWLFLLLLSSLGALALLVLCARRSSPYANRFGPHPFALQDDDFNHGCYTQQTGRTQRDANESVNEDLDAKSNSYNNTVPDEPINKNDTNQSNDFTDQSSMSSFTGDGKTTDYSASEVKDYSSLGK